MQALTSVHVLYPSCLESEDLMSPVSEKDFRDLSDKVSFLRGAATVVGALGVATIIGAFAWAWHLGSKVTAIEQQLADGGNTKLVTELNSPKSPEQLQANLALVSAQIQAARIDNKTPNTSKVKSLSEAVAQVSKRNPDLLQTWQAAGQLVSFGSNGYTVDRQKVCFNGTDLGHGPTPPSSATAILILQDVNCVFDLSNPGPDWEIARQKALAESGPNLPHVAGVGIVLENALVLYSGGPLPIGLSRIDFVNCSFRFQLNIIPPKNGQKLTQNLLEASNNENIQVTGL